MPIPFNQVGTPNPMRNQGASTSPSASGDPRLHRCSVGDFLGVAGPMGIGMSSAGRAITLSSKPNKNATTESSSTPRKIVQLPAAKLLNAGWDVSWLHHARICSISPPIGNASNSPRIKRVGMIQLASVVFTISANPTIIEGSVR
jgi:hypothetical protein